MKVNRTVYVIINRFIAPDIAMPNIIGYTLRNAQYTLESAGLKLGDTTSRTDFAKNTVLVISFNGNEIKPGDKIKQGSKIDLVISSGRGVEEIAIPKLIGLSMAEARVLLQANGLDIGSAVPNADVKNMDDAFVYRQEPMPATGRIRAGQLIDVWLQVEKPPTDSVQINQPLQIPQQQ